MACEQSQTVAHAYLDGELDALGAAEFERHLASCADCTATVNQWNAVRGGMPSAALREPAPARLKERIYADLHRGRRPEPARRSRPYLGWLAAAAAIILALFIAARFWPIDSRNAATPQLAAQVVDAHLRSLQPGHLLDVISTDQHTVKPWFDGKLDFSPAVQDFAGEGFPLQGGRLDVAGGRTVAALVYGRRKHIISVFVWPSPQPDTAPQSGSLQGYQWIGWRKGGMEYYVVSDVNAADLQQLQSLLSR
ncbi:MAG: anti-sigma factor [Candidatus Acidiferrales bacterium]